MYWPTGVAGTDNRMIRIPFGLGIVGEHAWRSFKWGAEARGLRNGGSRRMTMVNDLEREKTRRETKMYERQILLNQCPENWGEGRVVDIKGAVTVDSGR